MVLRDLRKNIENVVNQSNLSIDCIYFVFKDLMNEIENIYSQEIQKEVIQQEQQEEENNKEGGQE